MWPPNPGLATTCCPFCRPICAWCPCSGKAADGNYTWEAIFDILLEQCRGLISPKERRGPASLLPRQGGNAMSNLTGRADLHMHTCHSDGAPTVDALLEHVAHNTRLDVIAITDHNTISGALEACELQKKRSYPYEIIVGEEVSTRQGHMVGLFLR